MNRTLITGSRGQLGSDLTTALCQQHGVAQVIESGRSPQQNKSGNGLTSTYEVLDVTDRHHLQDTIEHYQVTTIYHLAGLLSATGEKHPEQCWDVNVNGLRNVLEIAKSHSIKVFWPSSIAVFGPHTPKLDTPQNTVEDPATIYGITKVTGEVLCQYYAQQFGVDVRSLRLPGLISYSTPPGGGTTDFAVEIFYSALKQGHYTCFVCPETRLPMMYMPDAIKAILDLMQVPAASITVRSSYNITAISFSASELVAEIQRHLPHFTCTYAPDFRQTIADSWPTVIDDSKARADWGWQPTYDLPAIVAEMLTKLPSPAAQSAMQ